jgi:hypothetical protein
VTSTWVAFEKSRVGSKMISGPAETPSDWVTAYGGQDCSNGSGAVIFNGKRTQN